MEAIPKCSRCHGFMPDGVEEYEAMTKEQRKHLCSCSRSHPGPGQPTQRARLDTQYEQDYTRTKFDQHL
jgi:hypothetical protein